MIYPKRLELLPQDEKWDFFFRCMYHRERERLGMLPDTSVPPCERCKTKDPN